MSRIANVSGSGWIVVAIVGAVIGAAAVTAPVAAASGPSVPGGITVYQVKRPCCHRYVTLGSQSNPSTIAVKAVPPGNYLVTGSIDVGAQTGSYIVCAVSNSLNGNDGVFGDYATAVGGTVTVSETEVITIATGQAIHLTCDDNSGKPGNVVFEEILEATPVNELH